MNSVEQILEFDKIKAQISNYCAFSLGKEKALNLKKSNQFLEIQRNLQMTNEAHILINKYGPLPMGGISDISLMINKSLRDGICQPFELVMVSNFCQGLNGIINYYQNIEIETYHFSDLILGLKYNKKIVTEINRCIDPSGYVLDNASMTLRQIRKEIRSLESNIRTKMESFVNENSDKLSEKIVAMRNNRHVVLVKQSDKNLIDGIVHGQSSSKQTTYIEPALIVSMNNKISQLKSEEEDEIERILSNLGKLVKEDAQNLSNSLETCATLDFMFAKGMYAQNNDCVVANITRSFSKLYFKNARHPLISREKVVSNTIEIVTPAKMLLVTGPNTGGKTVTLKTIGLFTLMTLCGLAIPSEEAIVPLFDHVYVDIGDDQSIERSLSTFSSHLAKIINIYQRVSPQSLVLLDEIGAGTDPLEGEALAISLLEYLLEINCFVCATTHYSKLKQFAKYHEKVNNASVEFDIETLSPTYRLLLGISGTSNAFDIALKLGLDPKIVARAKNLRIENETESEKMIKKLDQLVLKAKQDEELINAKKNEILLAEEKIAKEKQNLEKFILREKENAQLEALAYVENIQNKAKQLLDEINDKKINAKPHELIELKYQIDQLVPEEKVVIKNKSDHNYQVGEIVEVLSLKKQGEIIKIDSKGLLHVQVGIMKMKLAKDEVRYLRKAKNISTVNTNRNIFSQPKITMECNVIGKRASEALAIVDKYLDDALYNRLPSVRIIHGHGTGTLRKLIHELLSQKKFVKSYRLGQEGEGGVGATVVYFE